MVEKAFSLYSLNLFRIEKMILFQKLQLIKNIYNNFLIKFNK